MIIAAIALLLLAFLLVAAELFVPSHGILTLFAAAAAVASVFFAYKVGPTLSILFTVILIIATPVVFYYAVKIYPTTTVGKKVLLAQPAPSDVKAFQDEAAQLEALVGKRGIALTLLRPAGSIDVEGRMIDAMSESEIIEAGTIVEVIQVSGLKVIVKSAPA